MASDATPRSMVVYVATNKINSKEYVGLTTQGINRRISQHFDNAKRHTSNSPFHRAIRKYGTAAFVFSIVATATSIDELREIERAEIKKRNSRSPSGYNLTSGGDGMFEPAAETRSRMSDSQRRRAPHPPEVLEKIAAANRGRKMKPHVLEAMMAGKKRAGPMSVDQREKLRLASLGHRASEDAKAKMRAAHIGHPEKTTAAWSAKALPVEVDGVIYRSVRAAANARGSAHNTFQYRLNNKFPGYRYITNGQ